VGIKPGALERIARKLGRRKVNRGSEPNFGSPEVPDLGHPISIPHHSTLKPGTARNIINDLLSDVDVWEQYLDLTSADESVAESEETDEDDEDWSDTNEPTE
jgi:hypothetical protein